MNRLKRLVVTLMFGWPLMLILSVAIQSASGWYSIQRIEPATQLEGVLLNARVTPDSVLPGDGADLLLEVANQRTESIAPMIRISVPDGITIDLSRLPSGTSFNIQSGVLVWQPFLEGMGAAVQISVPLSADFADLRRPLKPIDIHMSDGKEEKAIKKELWVGFPPNASEIILKRTASVGELLLLGAELSGPGPVELEWHLGDGRVVNAITPEVSYPFTGTYEISLTATNPVGSDTIATQITIVPQPLARIDLDSTTVSIDQEIHFGNISGGLSPMSHHWRFGDGQESNLFEPSHRYSATGDYEVTLTVRSEYGESEASTIVSVGTPPLADFALDEPVLAGVVIQGQAFADSSAQMIEWQTGDGSVIQGPIFRHVYWSAGDYLLSMTARNDFGHTVISRLVNVQPGYLQLYLPFVSASAPVDETAPPEAESESVTDIDMAPEQELPVLELPATMPMNQQLLAYINSARNINGRSSLNPVQELSIAAQSHTDDMAALGFTSHKGSNGSSPAQRIQFAGYPGGYAGEATAWGMDSAIEPVRFWLSSPAHRAILLNPLATDVGIGYSFNLSAPNVWYWTAEFASMNLPVVEVEPLAIPVAESPHLTLLGPPRNSVFTLSPDIFLVFSWSWPQPLEVNERFAIYVKSGARTFQLGVVRDNRPDQQYQFRIRSTDIPAVGDQLQWQVRFENNTDEALTQESEFRFFSLGSPPVDQPGTQD